MDLSGAMGAVVSSIIVASLGTWWFLYVLKGLERLTSVQRRIVTAAIWLAYFVLTWILIEQIGAAA